jgi:serine/threonine protein kinase
MSGTPAGTGALLGKRLGKYDILALLALGGTAEIYLARIAGAAGFEKYVVVKCLHDHLADDTDFVKMFLDEARLGAMFDHSNVVQTFELGQHENRYYMVMEFLAGLSLAMVVRRAGERLPGGLLPVPLTFNIAAQACAGLHYAHERTANGRPVNLVHRDISPQNLVMSFEGVLKVVDFGIARAELRDTKTKAGTIKGKFAYMSPEQCVASNVDRRTDVFALGVIVWELLTGRRLFKRNSPYETYQAVIECTVPVPSSLNIELDPAIDPIVMKAVAKDKDHRYPTAEAFGDAMLGYLHHRGKSSGPSEVSRFFEQHFGQEIEEHGDRMRELIEGRVDSLDLSWGVEEDFAGMELANKGGASLDALVGELPGPEDEGGQPADKTRIETNPLDQIDQVSTQIKPPLSSSAVQARPVAGASSSERFPDLANLPTAVAQAASSPRQVMAPAATQSDQTTAELPAPHVVANRPMSQPMAAPPTTMQYAARPSVQMMAMPTDYPVIAGGRPFSSDLAPSNLGAPQRAPHTGMLSSPTQAMHVMSPVGDRYPQMDWEAAAARPAKAIPPWKLAVLFVAVMVGALLITLIIAKIVHH